MDVESKLVLISQEQTSQRDSLTQFVKAIGTLNRRLIALEQEVATLKAAHEAAVMAATAIAPERNCTCRD